MEAAAFIPHSPFPIPNSSDPWGNRTPVAGVRSRRPEPLDERAVVSAECVGQGSNLPSPEAAGLQSAWHPSAIRRDFPAVARVGVEPTSTGV